MMQTLVYIPERLAGWPVFGAGWLLALWALLSAIGVFITLRRPQGRDEVWGLLPLVLIFGGAIYWGLPNMVEPGRGLPIRGFGVLLLAGVVCGVGLSVRRARQMRLDPEIIYSLTFWMLILAIIGARLFYVIEYRHEFRRDTWSETLAAMVNVPSGGIVLYGALFGGLAAALLYFRKYRLPTLAMADIIAPGMAIGGSLGRVGCFLNGCCFGGLCTSDALPAVTFPPESAPYVRQLELGMLHGAQFRQTGERVEVARVFPDSAAQQAGLRSGDTLDTINGKPITELQQVRDLMFSGQPEWNIRLTSGDTKHLLFAPRRRSLPVHPAQLYDAINLALLSFLLWQYFPYRRHDGEVFALMLTLYPITRFVMEIIRVDEPSQLGTGLSISQLISIGLLLLAAPLWWWVERQRSHCLRPGELQPASP